MFLMVKKGININNKDDCGKKPLHLLSNLERNYPTKVSNYLVLEGANESIKDGNGLTAADLASDRKRHQPSCLKLDTLIKTVWSSCYLQPSVIKTFCGTRKCKVRKISRGSRRRKP